jgi:hypothetical protein
MTTTVPTPPSAPAGDGSGAEPPLRAAGAPPGRAHGVIGRAAGIAIPLGGVLMIVSTFFDPTSTEPEPRGMFVAYGADRAGADIAATVLHYGMASFGIGLLLAAFALAARRGRGLAITGGVLGALGFVNMSGAVLSDWYDAYNASVLGADRAMEISTAAGDMPALGMGWMLPGAVGCVLGPVLLAVGLARARVLAWWSVALPVVMGVMFAAAQALGAIGFLVTLVIGTAYGVIVAVGLRRHAVAEPA